MTTVAELIAELEEYPDDWEVFACNGMGISDPAFVEYADEDAKRVWVTS